MSPRDESLYQGLINRRSVRRFQDRPVPEKLLRRILWAGCHAPSAHNRQPWRFVVVRQGEKRRRWAASMAARFQADLAADGIPEELIRERVQSREQRLKEAPAAILMCLTTEDMDAYSDEPRAEAEETMTVQSVALAGGNMLLAAHALGLGACWMCAPLFARRETRQALDLPEGWEPQGVLILGYPMGEAEPRERNPVEQMAIWR